MSRQLDTRLSEADRLALEQVVRKSPDWRAHKRAKTLLLLSQPLLSREVAKLQDLNIEIEPPRLACAERRCGAYRSGIPCLL